MAVFNLRLDDENMAKRVPIAANMKVSMVLPGGIPLPSGIHTIGFIEGNVTIFRVSTVVTEAFDGTLPTADFTDSDGLIYANDRALGTVGSVGSPLTNPDGVTITEPIYKAGKTEFFVQVLDGGSTVGHVEIIVEYIQLDTTSGLHSGGRQNG